MIKRICEWKWAKELLPVWRIIDTKDMMIGITKVDGEFHMKLPIEIEYTSGDTRYPMRLHCDSLYMDVYNKGRGRDKPPYRLHAVINEMIELKPLETKIISYTFTGNEKGVPLLQGSTSCKILSVGTATLWRITKDQKLPHKVIRDIKINWEES